MKSIKLNLDEKEQKVNHRISPGSLVKRSQKFGKELSFASKLYTQALGWDITESTYHKSLERLEGLERFEKYQENSWFTLGFGTADEKYRQSGIVISQLDRYPGSGRNDPHDGVFQYFGEI